MKNKSLRNVLISIFVLLWIVLFHYESLRYFVLSDQGRRSLVKVPLLFPPAGWIMFYQVDDVYGHAQVYALRNGQPVPLDPHDILMPRFVGFDNIHRNVLSQVLSPRFQQPFCRYLKHKFPGEKSFLITAVQYPSVTERPRPRLQRSLYACQEEELDE